MQKLEKNRIIFAMIFFFIISIIPTKILANNFEISLINIENSKIYYKFYNNTKIDIYIENIESKKDLFFLQNFHSYWNLYLKDSRDIGNENICNEYEYHEDDIFKCASENKLFFKDISYLYKKPIFDDTHKLVNQYANQWTIDPEYIKQNFSKDYYKENPDGSIDIELTLYFKPQSYFYLGLIISGTTLIGCLGYLGYDFIKRRKRGKDETDI